MPGGKVSFTYSTPQVCTVVFLSFKKNFLSTTLSHFAHLITNRAVFLDGASILFMVAVARERFEVPVAVVAVRPRIDTVGGKAISVTTLVREKAVNIVQNIGGFAVNV